MQERRFRTAYQFPPAAMTMLFPNSTGILPLSSGLFGQLAHSRSILATCRVVQPGFCISRRTS